MEIRDDWEQILLNGLPEQQRQQTLASIALANDDKLRQIRTQNTVELRRDRDRRLREQPDDDDLVSA